MICIFGKKNAIDQSLKLKADAFSRNKPVLLYWLNPGFLLIVLSPNFVSGLIGLAAFSDGEPAELVPCCA